MKKIQLNLSERLFAIGLMNDFKGPHETLAFILEDIKQYAIEDKEWKKGERIVNKGKNEKGEPVESWAWNDEKGGNKEIEINDKVLEYLVDVIETKNKVGEFTLQDKAVITLNKKLVEVK